MVQEKIAIVTGGASGIGLAIAEKFVKNNITTIIIGRNEEKSKQCQKTSWERFAKPYHLI